MFNALTEEARNLLALCAAVGEPVLIGDVLAMAPDLFSGPVSVLDAARQAGERIYGDGETLGYTLSDPEMQAVWMTELQSSDLWSGWQMRFLDYGGRILEGLRTQLLAPRQTPACVVYGYGRALEAIEAPLEVRARLLCRAWADAWEWLGWPQGFQAEATRIFDSAAKDPANLGIMILAGLCHGAVGHWVAIPPRFMGEALKRDLISPAQTLSLADLANGDERIYGETLGTIYRLLPPDYARQIDEEIANLHVRVVQWDSSGVEDPGKVLPEKDAEEQLQHYEQSLGGVRSEEVIYKIIDLVDMLPENYIERGLDLWEQAADYDYSFPTDVIYRLPERLVERVFSMGITMLYSGSKYATASGIDVLTMLLPRLTDRQLMNLIELHRISAKRDFSIEPVVSELPTPVLEMLLDKLSRERKGEEVTKAVEELRRLLDTRKQAAESKKNDAQYASSVERLPPSEVELTKELAEIRGIKDLSWRISRLITYIQKIKTDQRDMLIEEALNLLWKLPDEGNTAKAIMELGPLLNARQAETVLELARRTPLDHPFRGYSSWSRSQAVLALAPAIPDDRRMEILAEAVRWAREEVQLDYRERVLRDITGRLPVGLRYSILEGLWELYSDDRAYKNWHDFKDVFYQFSKVWFEMCRINDVDPYDTLVKTLRVVMGGPIWFVSDYLRAFHAILYQMGGERAIVDAITADLDTSIWWS
ncbi:MAG: hypothetical protein JW987_05265 [Anaerolineaceae bacterium]|nr:hypothetical protein [Anaerolineaceae bacterium]